MAFYIGLSLLLYFLATRFVKPIRPWRMSWLGISLVAITATLYIVITAATFYPDVRNEIAVRQQTPTPFPARMEQRVEFAVEEEVELEATAEPTTEPTAESSEP